MRTVHVLAFFDSQNKKEKVKSVRQTQGGRRVSEFVKWNWDLVVPWVEDARRKKKKKKKHVKDEGVWSSPQLLRLTHLNFLHPKTFPFFYFRMLMSWWCHWWTAANNSLSNREQYTTAEDDDDERRWRSNQNRRPCHSNSKPSLV